MRATSARSFARASAALVTLLAAATPLHAQTPASAPPNAGALAVQKGDEGINLYARGQWDQAYRVLSEAEQLYHSPVFLLYQARSLRNAGHMLAAQAILRRLNAELIDAAAPEPWKHAQADGRIELAALEQDVPSVVIVVKGASPRATILLDGAAAANGQRIELDPGHHALVASDGAQRVEKAFTVAAGADQLRVVLALKSEPSAATAPRRAARGPYVPGLIIAVAGGASVIGGAIVGAVARSQASKVTDSLPATCVGSTCLPSAKSMIEPHFDHARTLASAADVLLVGGASLALAGAILWLIDPRGQPAVTAAVSARGGAMQLCF
jgi:hypothetical protein